MARRVEVPLGKGTQLAVRSVHAAAQGAHVDLHDLRAAHRTAVAQGEAELLSKARLKRVSGRLA